MCRCAQPHTFVACFLQLVMHSSVFVLVYLIFCCAVKSAGKWTGFGEVSESIWLMRRLNFLPHHLLCSQETSPRGNGETTAHIMAPCLIFRDRFVHKMRSATFVQSCCFLCMCCQWFSVSWVVSRMNCGVALQRSKMIKIITVLTQEYQQHLQACSLTCKICKMCTQLASLYGTHEVER